MAKPAGTVPAARFDALAVRPPERDAAALAAAKQRLGELVVDHTQHKSVDRAVRSLTPGARAPSFKFRGDLPPDGRSGVADRLPLLQFAPAALREPLEKLGVRTLADFLARAALADGRLILGRMLGVPEPSLLLAAHRAELLDLPVTRERAKAPHLKDVLLLGRLGVAGVHALARLAPVLEARPPRLELLLGLVARLQKANPAAYVGRERITRQELREWPAAARRRGSDVHIVAPARAAGAPSPGRHTLHVPDRATLAAEVAALRGSAGARTLVELAAASAVTWHLESRWRDPDAAWHELVIRLALLLRKEGVDAIAENEARLHDEVGAERLAGYRRIAAPREVDVSAELAAYAAWVAGSDEPSLFHALAPWSRPDTARADRLLGFWLEPAPSARAQLPPGSEAPAALQPAYVCFEPETGGVDRQTKGCP